MGDIAGLGLQAPIRLVRVRVAGPSGGKSLGPTMDPGSHLPVTHRQPWIRNSIGELVLVVWLAEARSTRQPEKVSGDA